MTNAELYSMAIYGTLWYFHKSIRHKQDFAA